MKRSAVALSTNSEPLRRGRRKSSSIPTKNRGMHTSAVSTTCTMSCISCIYLFVHLPYYYNVLFFCSGSCGISGQCYKT